MNSKSKTRQDSRPLETPEGEPVSFGTWLRRQREAREISLREIADASKVSLRYLEAFEQDRFELLPARVFIQGFLREYARYVGLDPDEVVNHYLASQARLEPDDIPRPQAATSLSPRFTWVWQLVLVVAVIGTLALAAVLAFESERKRSAQAPSGASSSAQAQDESDNDGGAEQIAAEQIAAAQPPRVGEPLTPSEGPAPPGEAPAVVESPVPAEPPASTPASPLLVALSFSESCWVEMTVDGRRSQREHATGESLEIAAQRAVVLTLGNAGGVTIRVNGRPFAFERGSGQVVRDIRIDLATVQELSEGP